MKEGRYIWLILFALALMLISFCWLGFNLYKSDFFKEFQSRDLNVERRSEKESETMEEGYLRSLNRAESLSVELNKELSKLRELKHKMRSQVMLPKVDSSDSGFYSAPDLKMPGSGTEGNNQIGSEEGTPSSGIYEKLILKPVSLRAFYYESGLRRFTTSASAADEFLVEIYCTGKSLSDAKDELYLLLIKPDGMVARPQATAGIFKPAKIWLPYTRRVPANCQAEKCEFSLSGFDLKPGPYILQIYQNDKFIGKLVAVLN